MADTSTTKPVPAAPTVSDLAPVPVIVHLSGTRRGTTQRLSGPTLRIGIAPEVEIRVAEEPSVGPVHATLFANNSTYELVGVEEYPVWVNGERVERALLDSGDVIEVGRDGPILRFRLYPAGSRAWKSPTEAFSDCVDCARHSDSSPVRQAATILATAPRELATQTSHWYRLAMIAAALVLLIAVALQFRQVRELEERLDTRDLEIEGIADLIRAPGNYLSDEDLARVRTQLRQTEDRIEALEERTDAPARVLSVAAASVAFVQGAYGFVDMKSGNDLRFVFDAEKGLPVAGPDGSPLVTVGGEGPVVEAIFTGTAFVATSDGLLLTNRHVALPWLYDQAAGQVLALGLTPVMRRFSGYLPGGNDPFDIALVVASDTADLAVLRCGPVTSRVPPLELSLETQVAGEEILVLGYPTGIRALLARTDEELVDRLASKQNLDVWEVAKELAAAGHVNPLASRGIVAQVTPSAVVFDAETTHGGSGGPVLDFEGRVVAVTSAIVPEFGGSNLGVPSVEARWLLLSAASQSLVPPRIR